MLFAYLYSRVVDGIIQVPPATSNFIEQGADCVEIRVGFSRRGDQAVFVDGWYFELAVRT